MTIEEHKEWFERFARTKIALAADASPLETKLGHTWRVLENAEKILASENAPQKLERAGCLAALYHDLGRFDQYLRYGTFKDSLSRNHALLSVETAKRAGILDEEPEIRSLVLAAIGLHNRRALPDIPQDDLLFLARVVRDADKIDILRVMADCLAGPKPYNPTVVLSLPDEDTLSPVLAEKILAGVVPDYDDLRSVNDFRLLLGAWAMDMNFAGSRQLYRTSGFGQKLVEGVPDKKPYAKIRDYLLKIME
ncbi:MAG: HD domain-containing protein [Desulfovibrio sp.]|nr:HD domain-containing protein [Desulfovibrio sp.]